MVRFEQLACAQDSREGIGRKCESTPFQIYSLAGCHRHGRSCNTSFGDRDTDAKVSHSLVLTVHHQGNPITLKIQSTKKMSTRRQKVLVVQQLSLSACKPPLPILLFCETNAHACRRKQGGNTKSTSGLVIKRPCRRKMIRDDCTRPTSSSFIRRPFAAAFPLDTLLLREPEIHLLLGPKLAHTS